MGETLCGKLQGLFFFGVQLIRIEGSLPLSVAGRDSPDEGGLKTLDKELEEARREVHDVHIPEQEDCDPESSQVALLPVEL